MIELECDRIARGNRKYSLNNADWKESDHPRADDGKFGTGGGSTKSVKKEINTKGDKLKEWFGGSKITNPDGTPRKMYHGSPANYDSIDPSKSHGMIWLTDNRKYADYFAGEEGNTKNVYAKVENPLDVSELTLEENLATWQENIESMGIDTSNIDWDAANWAPDYGMYTFFDLLPHAGNNYIDIGLLDKIKEAGYDGILAPKEENDGIESDYNVVAFESDQIKLNTTNNSIKVYRV